MWELLYWYTPPESCLLFTVKNVLSGEIVRDLPHDPTSFEWEAGDLMTLDEFDI